MDFTGRSYMLITSESERILRALIKIQAFCDPWIAWLWLTSAQIFLSHRANQ